MLDNNAVFRCSTEDFPEHQRLSTWREAFCRIALRAEVTPLDDHETFHAELSMRMLPGLVVSWGSNSRLRLERTRKLATDSDDDLFLIMPTWGSAVGEQLGREAFIGPGSAVLGSSAHLGAMSNSTGFSHITLKLPRRVVEANVFNVDRLIMQPIGAGGEALAMLRNYAGMLVGGQSLATTDLQHLCVAHIHDLVALALGARSEVRQIARDRGLRAARLVAARAYILENLIRPDLSVTTVAASQKITPRYLQMLFEAEGTTFSEFVLKQRLARTHRMLIDPRLAARPISAIALDAGFGDLSYFNLAFRRQYGSTPSDIRAGTKRPDA